MVTRRFLQIFFIVCSFGVFPYNASAQDISYLSFVVQFEDPNGGAPLMASDIQFDIFDDLNQLIGTGMTDSTGWGYTPPSGSVFFPEYESIRIKFLPSISTCSECSNYKDGSFWFYLDPYDPNFYYDGASELLDLTPVSPTPLVLEAETQATSFFRIRLTEGTPTPNGPLGGGTGGNMPPDLGDPIPDLEVHVCNSDFSQCNMEYTNQNGVALFPKDETSSELHYVDVYGDGIQPVYVSLFADPTQTQQTVDLQTLVGNSTLTINLINSSTNAAWGLPAEANYGDVYCNRLGIAPVYYSETLNTGQDSVAMTVLPGVYDCSLWVDFYDPNNPTAPPSAQVAAASVQVTVTSGQNASGSITVIDTESENAKIRVEVVDETTLQPISGISLFLDIWTEYGSAVDHYGHGETTEGFYEFDAIADATYTASAYIYDDGTGLTNNTARAKKKGRKLFRSIKSADGTGWVLSNSLQTVTALADQVVTTQIKAKQSNAAVEVTLRRGDGTLIQNGWADLFCPSGGGFLGGPAGAAAPGAAPSQDFWVGAEVVNGVATLNAFATDNTCFLNAFPYFDGAEGAAGAQSNFPPPQQSIVLKADQTLQRTFTVEAPNHTVTINTTVQDEDGNAVDTASLYSLFCFAHNALEQHNFIDVLYDGTNELPLLIANPKKPTPWTVECHADNGESFFTGGIVYKPAKNSTAGTVDILLREGLPFYEEVKHSFEGNKAQELAFADNKFVSSIPSGAVPNCDSGTVNFSAESARNVSEDSDGGIALALSFAMNCTVDGTTTSVTELNKSINACFTVDLTELSDDGSAVDSDELYIASYNENTGKWTRDSTSYVITDDGDDDPNTVQVCGTITHFSIWAALIDSIKTLQASVVDNITARAKRLSVVKSGKVRRNKFTLKWDAPTDDEGEEYDEDTLDTMLYNVYYTRVKKSSQCDDVDWSEESGIKHVEVIGKTKYKKSRLNRTKKKKVVCYRVDVNGGDGVTGSKRLR